MTGGYTLAHVYTLTLHDATGGERIGQTATEPAKLDLRWDDSSNRGEPVCIIHQRVHSFLFQIIIGKMMSRADSQISVVQAKSILLYVPELYIK